MAQMASLSLPHVVSLKLSGNFGLAKQVEKREHRI